MKRRRDLLRTSATLMTAAGVLASTVVFAQSNCINGPPSSAAVGAADITSLSVDACAVTSDAANCDNPGNEPHVILWNQALLASGDLEDELVVIFPGSGQDPTNVQWLARAAAYAGYRTIGLAYEGDSLEAACGNQVGPSHSGCVLGFRRDVLLGTPAPPAGVTDVHRANSAELRLLDLLADLDSTHPADGWDEYFSGSSLNHDKIVVSGYSLGSGHAAFWARLERFAGVVTISGPTDSSCVDFPYDRTLHPGLFYPMACTNVLAAWVRDENPATPGVVRYGAFHAEEAVFLKLDAIIRTWDNFGLPRLPGSHLTLDVTDGYDFGSRSPWPLAAAEHRFSFNTPVPSGCSAHQAAAADGCLELDQASGLPLAYPLYMNLYCAAGADLP